MGEWARAMTICQILAEAYPNGLTIEEILEKGKSIDSRRFKSCFDVKWSLGIDSSKRGACSGCWYEKGGKIYYDRSRRIYHDFGSLTSRFAKELNDWLCKNGLSHLILYEPVLPENSPECPLGIRWERITSPEQCDWNYDAKCLNGEGCTVNCGLSHDKIKGWLQVKEHDPY